MIIGHRTLIGRVVVAALTASLVASATLAAVLASPAAALDVEIVNKSGQADDRVYVMLHNGSSSDGQLRNEVPVKLSAIRNRKFSLDRIAAGRIYFSFDSPVAFNERNDSPTRYDKIELTYPGDANLTDVDFFAIRMKIEALDRTGKSLGTRSYQADTNTIKQDLLAIPGARGALVKTRSGDMARILSPQLSPPSYPSFDRYIRSLAGQIVTLRGEFFGDPHQTFVYSGTFTADGSITLNGTITTGGGQPARGEALSVEGSTLPEAIYTVNGPYNWGGRTHRVTDNDVYAVIYRDLLAGFAWGYWGGKYGNDSAKWQGKPPFAAARKSRESYATYNQYADVIYQRSDSYGFSFSDTGPKKVQLHLTDAATLRITILPDGSSGQAGKPKGPLPDLVVSGVPAPSAAERLPGSSLRVRARVRNRGKARARKRSRVGYFLSENRRRSAGDIRLEADSRHHRAPRLRPGRHRRGGMKAVVPARTPPGTYRLIACADVNDRVRESREGNNCTVARRLITVRSHP